MSLEPLAAALIFSLGLAMAALAVLPPQQQSGRLKMPSAASLRDFLPTVKEGDEQSMRLAGITTEAYAVQRFFGLIAGLAAGAAISTLWGRGPLGYALVVAAAASAGWLLPMVGMRDTAKRARAELDHVVRMWIVLVAQQISAGMEPEAAMLSAVRMGRRDSWRLLQRHLLAARHERRPAWEGLADLVDRYGVHSLTPVVSSLGLAADRGTRLSDAILVAADTLWGQGRDQQREKAARLAQIIVIPGTAVALALAGILVYPPFTSLTGGGLAGLP